MKEFTVLNSCYFTVRKEEIFIWNIFPGILWPQEKVSWRSLEVNFTRFNEHNWDYKVFAGSRVKVHWTKNVPYWQIGHFRVLLCLCFKTSLSAKPFIYENEFCTQFHFHANLSHFNKNGFALRLALKQRRIMAYSILLVFLITSQVTQV